MRTAASLSRAHDIKHPDVPASLPSHPSHPYQADPSTPAPVGAPSAPADRAASGLGPLPFQGTGSSRHACTCTIEGWCSISSRSSWRFGCPADRDASGVGPLAF
eukprot:scaffold290931_cov20-Tisochrysis_lutea.AAC.1